MASCTCIREHHGKGTATTAVHDCPVHGAPQGVRLELTDQEAHDLHHALSTTVQLIDQVTVPPHAPLYGARPRLLAVARRLDHERKSPGVPNPNRPGEADGG